MTSLHKICQLPVSQSTIMTSCMIIIAVLIRSSLSQFVCPEMFGMFQYPDNCAMFYVCNYGIPYQRTCPTGLLFDINLGVCRHSVQVHCFNETHQLTAGFTCPTPIGIYTDPTSCEHFYLCANGRGFRQKCPFGLIFDGVVCNWKKDNNCTPTWKSSLRDGINIDTKPNDPSRRSRVISTKKSSEKLVPSTKDEHQRNQDGVSLPTSTEENRIIDEFEWNRKQMRNKSDQSTGMGNLTENKQGQQQHQQQRKGNSNSERPRGEEKTVIGKAKVKNVKNAEEEGKENNENDGNKARDRYLKEYLAREGKRRKFLKELEKKRSELWQRQQQLRRKLLRQHQLRQRKLFMMRQKQQQRQLQQSQEKKQDQQRQNGSIPQLQQHEEHKQQDQQQQPQQKEEQQQLQKEQQLLENEDHHHQQQHQQEKQEQSTPRNRNLKANEIRDIWSKSDQSNTSKSAWKPNSSKGSSHTEKGLYPSLFHSSVSNQIFLVNQQIKPNYTNDNIDDGGIVKDSKSSNSNASRSNNNNINSNSINKAVSSGNAR
ncbi:putative uncharacterized protein DDB_G0274435 [Octopus bimaculoides]|nr:putative uncharacterized protein DDB_G0274435 [Octopus bimaculoides]